MAPVCLRQERAATRHWAYRPGRAGRRQWLRQNDGPNGNGGRVGEFRARAQARGRGEGWGAGRSRPALVDAGIVAATFNTSPLIADGSKRKKAAWLVSWRGTSQAAPFPMPNQASSVPHFYFGARVRLGPSTSVVRHGSKASWIAGAAPKTNPMPR